MTLKNNRAPLRRNIKLYALFHHHMWIQTWVTVRKRLSWVVTSVTLTFALWLWPFAWTLVWSLVITPEDFMMIQWWEHSQKGVTDRQTDRQTENTICRVAWSQLKKQAYGTAAEDMTDIRLSVYNALKTGNNLQLYISAYIFQGGGGSGYLPFYLLSRFFLVAVYDHKQALGYFVSMNEYFYILRVSCPN